LASKEPFVTKTFRVNQDLWKPIEDKARSDGISENQLVNQILRTYSVMVWYDRFKGLMISPGTMRGIIKGISDQQIEEAGREAGMIGPRSLLLMIGAPLNLESLVQFMTRGFDERMNWFQCDHHTTKDELVFHLRHDLGGKWSTFLNGYIQSMFKSILDTKVRTEVLDGSITVYARINQLV